MRFFACTLDGGNLPVYMFILLVDKALLANRKAGQLGLGVGEDSGSVVKSRSHHVIL